MNNETDTVIGILAHVDAGKTTLTEAMLYLSGKTKKLGRVDHRDSYLDNHELERERGITIFSKQARLELGGRGFTLLDTPGHVDFSAEAERTLQVLDAAVLVISGTDGPQAHTQTLWGLLKRYSVPVFVFVTKMDLPGMSREEHIRALREDFGDGFADFTADEDEVREQSAMCGETLMEKYLSGGLSDGDIAQGIRERRIFPCLFGSGLNTDGVDALLEALRRYSLPGEYGGDFAARVYKIARDAQGGRLTYMKICGGELRVRDALSYTGENGEKYEEKINALRLYSGIKYDAADTVRSGQICAALGLSGTYPGQGLGALKNADARISESAVSYSLILPKGMDERTLLPKLRLLCEEDPQLDIVWNEQTRSISLRLMGRVQAEIFKSLVKERFDVNVALDSGHIMYKETIADTVEGVGHYEPLRHYAEVHLLMRPLPAGSGIVLDTAASEDELDRNWQRLILTHLQEKPHLGCLTGSPITDVQITLVSGRAHLKHTEGGDFRQATYRAVRQGLMQAQGVLLEPWYAFSLRVPADQIGRAMSDVRAMSGSFEPPADEPGGMLRLDGSAPVSEMNGYAETLVSYTHGRGALSFRLEGYRPCHNARQVIEAIGYDALSDTENTPDSVFCAHGAGFNVSWDRVKDYMHLESSLKKPEEAPPRAPARYRSADIDERELEEIMRREFGPIRRAQYSLPQAPESAAAPAAASRKEYLIVDGYNLIFAWSELKALAADRLDLARSRLMDMLSNYCGYTRSELVLVFDGFRTPGNPGSRSDYHNIHVAYTGDGVTGDAYIEQLASQIGKNYSVRVVTSDNLIRLSALRSGVLRTSSKEFEGEVDFVLERIDEVLRATNLNAHKVKLKDGKQ